MGAFFYFNYLYIIAEKRGESYLVNIKDKNKAKTLICRPEHLKKIEGGN